MKFSSSIIIVVLFLSACDTAADAPKTTAAPAPYELWLSNADQSAKFQKQTVDGNGSGASTLPLIQVTAANTFQSIEGFGCALTGGSAQLLHAMSADARAALLKELFATDGNNIGISALRISIGASDLDDHVFSYDDLPTGQSDTAMAYFSLDPDRTHLIPILKEILAINPEISILGSPWSAPVWMKSGGSSIGGSLKVSYYAAYAKYFVKYLQAMKAEGITVSAITVQNEPLHGGNNPSMVMQASEQMLFVRNYLGPAFAAAGLTTRIIIYDHNADRTDYPLAVLADSVARKYVDGSAFHLYGGNIASLSDVHNAYPDKHLYFTEQWIGAPGNFANDLNWHIGTLIIGATQNWCRSVLEWNLASDPGLSIHTPGGCSECLGAVTISGSTVTRNPAYYIMAHAAKFVRPGSRRVESSQLGGLPNVAFVRPDGKTVLVVLNAATQAASFRIDDGTKNFVTSLRPGSVGTYVW